MTLVSSLNLLICEILGRWVLRLSRWSHPDQGTHSRQTVLVLMSPVSLAPGNLIPTVQLLIWV